MPKSTSASGASLTTALGDAATGDLLLHLWRMPNQISTLPVDAYDPRSATLTFQAEKLTPYTKAQSFFADFYMWMRYPVVETAAAKEI